MSNLRGQGTGDAEIQKPIGVACEVGETVSIEGKFLDKLPDGNYLVISEQRIIRTKGKTCYFDTIFELKRQA